jgi:hypothetical protein
LEILLQVGLVCVAVGVVCAALRPRSAFVVRIERGVPRATQGNVTRAFLQEIAETCSRHAVTAGVVRGIVRGNRIALAFSKGISPACQQQLRNLWALSGWTATSN